ncbi:MAG: peptidyl-prolyl cis-trans isomerase [Rhizobiales bacterium]|nr:peptidyl-prolyl cis-trans isomerase [Hyphomicrobiales bacterium]MBI3672620.1 peptidyl-prolyl cis-trans isomerase [Hyphomicrobiales bacterium]
MSAGCTVKSIVAPKPNAVTINSIEIPRAEIARETQNHPAKSPIEAWKAAARALAIRELLLQEARRLDIVAHPMSDDEGRRETEEEALVRLVIEREVITPKAGVEDCRRYYAQNLRRFRSPAIFEASHILLIAPSGDRKARAAARGQADLVIAKLQANPAAFATLARQYSACPSREVGGNLGQIGPGQTVPEFEQALGTLAVGVIHGEPIESRYGFHIVRLDRREDGCQLPFELVQPRIAAYLEVHVRRTAIRQYIGLLAGRATVIGIDLNASNSALLQ